MIYGERIRQVREMHGLTQTDLANDIPPLTQSHMSRIEKGLAEPDTELVAMLAAYLSVSVEFFKVPTIEELQAQSPQFRARSRLTQGAKASALQWARLVYEQYSHLRSTARSIPVGLERLVGQTPVEAANRVRSALGFDERQPLPYLLLAVERLGVCVLGLPYRVTTMDAFSAWYHEDPIIGVLSGAPGDRLRFSVAHELGHLVLHHSGQTGKAVETEADQFAAELLAPLASLAAVMPRHPTLNGLLMLKSQWGLSIKSLVRRARELGAIDDERSASLYRQISARGWTRVEPGHVPTEKPRAFRKLIEIHYGQSPYVPTFARDAGWSEELALRIIGEHASVEDLPFAAPPSSSPRAEDSGNVVPMRPRRPRAFHTG